MRALHDFFNMWETQTGIKHRELHCDAGTEFKNKAVGAELAARGMQFLPAATDTQAQNGPAKRGHRTITEAARTMCLAVGIPPNLWLYAVRTAVTVINLLPASGNHGSKSPHEALYQFLQIPEKKPYIKHLRTFGCTAYVHKKGALKPQRADKLQS